MSTKTFEQFQQQLEESWDDATSMSSTFPLFKPATTSNTIIPPQPVDDPSTGKGRFIIYPVHLHRGTKQVHPGHAGVLNIILSLAPTLPEPSKWLIFLII